MLRRLFVGLLIGAVVGALVAAGVIFGLGMVAVPVFLGFALAAATGALTGLVAGKPIWASGGQIEAGLKAFFGALLAAGGLYAIRTWLPVQVPLALVHYMTTLQPGAHVDTNLLGDLPGAFLPLIAAALGGLYELDNTPESKTDGEKGSEKRGARVSSKIRISADADGDEEEADAPPAAKKRSR